MKLRVSVSDLIMFACRTGDLVYTGSAGPTALQGIRAHQKLQSQLDAESEVTLKAEIQVDDTRVTVGGRIDILSPDPELPVINEIKSTLVPPARVAAGVQAQHWSQLKVYGYLYLISLAPVDEQKAQSVLLNLIWYNLNDESLSKESREIDFPELKTFTLDALRRYVAWISNIERWRQNTKETAGALDFPHESFRAGQRDLAAASYRSIRDSGYLLCEAPTGIGKTISTLFPAVKAIGDGHTRQITYLTAKTSGRAVARDAISIMEQAGLKITSLVITSKASACHCINGTCNREADGRCPLTIGFFDRLPAAREELIDNGRLDNSFLDEVATRHQVCPFELSLQMIPWVSIVICDFNYVFDPLVVLAVFADPKKDMMLLLDEAHNLVDRSRAMYSAKLSRLQNRQVIKECRDSHEYLAKSLQRLSCAFDRWARKCGTDESSSSELPDGISKLVTEAVDLIMGSLETGPPLPDSARDWFRELFRYRVIEELFGDHHRSVTRISRQQGAKEIELKLMCVNATDKLQRTFRKFNSAIAFSATLRPTEYYYNALGLPEGAQTLSLTSPFSSRQLGCFVCGFIDTRYKVRSLSEEPIARVIKELISARLGNYLVFFPSYAYMEKVFEKFVNAYTEFDVIKQERSFSIDEREHFLEQFSGNKPVLGFAIMGGVFGEGIDYTGDKLIGCILVGTGLPGLGLESQLIADDYTRAGLNGFDYAYRFPGFTKVLQTAGRVIRDEKDRGVVALVDQRFTEPFYRKLYPEHWFVQYCHHQRELVRKLDSFWSSPDAQKGG